MGLSHSPSLVMNGLVLCLDAGNTKSYPGTGTTWTDLSGRGNTGTLTNGPTYSSSNGGSLVFDGSDDYVNLGSLQLNTASGTIGFWIQLTNTITIGYTGNQRPFGSNNNFEARWSGGDDLRLDLGADSTLIAERTWSNTSWYYIVATWNSSTTSSALYVDSILNATGTTGSTATLTSLTGTLYLGRSAIGGYLGGKMPIFQAYNRALTASEIQQNYNALKGRFNI